MEGPMLKANLWEKNVPRVELDQRARGSRLGFECMERLLLLRDPVTPSRRRRIFCFLRSASHTPSGELAESGGPLTNRRPLRTQTTPEHWLQVCGPYL